MASPLNSPSRKGASSITQPTRNVARSFASVANKFNNTSSPSVTPKTIASAAAVAAADKLETPSKLQVTTTQDSKTFKPVSSSVKTPEFQAYIEQLRTQAISRREARFGSKLTSGTVPDNNANEQAMTRPAGLNFNEDASLPASDRGLPDKGVDGAANTRPNSDVAMDDRTTF